MVRVIRFQNVSTLKAGLFPDPDVITHWSSSETLTVIRPDTRPFALFLDAGFLMHKGRPSFQPLRPVLDASRLPSACVQAVLLTSRQADGATAVALDVVLGPDVDVLLAQPPQAKVGGLTRLVHLLHAGAQHGPVVRHHRHQHAGHAHHQHPHGHLDLGALVHGSVTYGPPWLPLPVLQVGTKMEVGTVQEWCLSGGVK